ncbi:MAG: hypothetical protein MUF10_10385 [Thermoanaerobaculaceae bacterium]|jgi:hypothetical protein|nr:hypothetical protein [Thermoanaerobaculaceae bacterium]
MKTAGRLLLALGGIGSVLIALLHLAIIVIGPGGYRYFGAAELAPMAERGSPVPALLTLCIAVVFAVWGAYGLSGAGVLPRLPLLRPALLAIGTIYGLRGLVAIPELIQTARGQPLIPRFLVFSLTALVLGLLHLGGAVLSWGSLSQPEGTHVA